MIWVHVPSAGTEDNVISEGKIIGAKYKTILKDKPLNLLITDATNLIWLRLSYAAKKNEHKVLTQESEILFFYYT